MPPLILWSLVVAYSVSFSILSIARHYAFYSLEDAGAFSQMFWTTLHGRLFYTDVPGMGRFAFTPHNYLGEHFSPILFVLIPVYALWPGPEILLILQSVVLGLAAVPLYMLAQHRFNDRYLSMAFAVSWLIAPHVWQSNIADFHLDTLEPLFIFSAFYCLFTRRIPHYLTLILLSLLCKEDTFVYVIAIGIFAVVTVQDTKTGLWTIGMAVLWAVATFKLFMPLFGGGMAYLDHYSEFGDDVGAILKTFLLQPQKIIAHLTQQPILWTIFWIFFTVGFLPLLSPAGLLLVTPSALERLLTNKPHINTLSWYYSMAVLPLLFIASLAATSNIGRLVRTEAGRRRYVRCVGSVLVIAGVIAASHLGFGIVGGFALRMPAPVVSKDAWLWVTRRDSDIRRLLSGIPEGPSVSTSPHILPHVSKRFEIRIYPYRPLNRDIILLDLYGDTYPADLATLKCVLVDTLAGTEYGVVEYLDGFLYLRRGQATSRNAAVAGHVASLFEAEEMPAENAGRVFDAEAGNKRARLLSPKPRSPGVVFGPYISLPPGEYELAFRLKVRHRAPEEIARIDVSADNGRRILAERIVRGSDFHEAGRYQEFELTLHTEERLQNVEFRVHRYGGTAVWVDRINLYPESLALEVARESCRR